MAHAGWFEFLSVAQLKKLQAYNDKLDDPVQCAKALGVRLYKPSGMVVDGPLDESTLAMIKRYEERSK